MMRLARISKILATTCIYALSIRALCTENSMVQQEEIRSYISELSSAPNAENALEVVGPTTCGESQKLSAYYEAIASKLSRIGANAAPMLEAAIRQVYLTSDNSPSLLGAKWLLLVYAKIQGSNAVPLFHQILTRNQSGRNLEDLDAPMAQALGTTAFVSIPQPSVRRIFCHRPPRVEDALKELITAVGNADGAAVRSLVQTTQIEELNRAIDSLGMGAVNLTEAKIRPIGVGFTLMDQPAIIWSSSSPDSTESIVAESSIVDVRFVDAGGAECVSRKVKFVRLRETGANGIPYRIISDTPSRLLAEIATCAIQPK